MIKRKGYEKKKIGLGKMFLTNSLNQYFKVM